MAKTILKKSWEMLGQSQSQWDLCSNKKIIPIINKKLNLKIQKNVENGSISRFQRFLYLLGKKIIFKL